MAPDGNGGTFIMRTPLFIVVMSHQNDHPLRRLIVNVVNILVFACHDPGLNLSCVLLPHFAYSILQVYTQQWKPMAF